MPSVVSSNKSSRARTPLWVKVAIKTFAFAVGLAIFATVDHYTGWIGIF
jgi:hypothetical protein